MNIWFALRMKETDTFPTDRILTAAVFVQTQMQIEEKHSLIAPSNLRLKRSGISFGKLQNVSTVARPVDTLYIYGELSGK